MRVALLAMVAALGALITGSLAQDKFAGGYLLLPRSRDGKIVGMDELAAMASKASSLPVNRVWLAFFAPTMVYEPGSNTLENCGLGVSTTGDYGFAEIKKYIGQLQAGGVEVFLSMGGWNYNCFPYLYARYSVGGYGTATPNYWKIQKYGGGSLDNCKEENQFCYVCEPPSEGTSMSDFQIFPEPQFSPTWQNATAYVEAHAGGSSKPQWAYDMMPGSQWTDTKTGISVTVPGNPLFVQKKRDPYQDLVYLAKDMGAAGIDLDYEEFWHGDYFKTGTGPWELTQTVYKYAAIARDVMLNVQAIYPTLKVSTAAGAVGAWQGKWWGGNLKGVWFYANQWYPDTIAFMAKGANAGGINVMTYDLSDNEQYHECPEDGVCTLDEQVKFYMNTYQSASIPANVGYEVGTPAYPDPTHDKDHQLPLTKEKLQTIVSSIQTSYNGGFMWEFYKPADDTDNASPTDVAQAICKATLGSAARCSGVIPPISNLTRH